MSIRTRPSHPAASTAGSAEDRVARRTRRRALITIAVLTALAAILAFGLLALGNPMPVGSAGFWLIAQLRSTTLIAMAIVAICQAVATVSFHTVTTNRIITPSVMGFEALYIAVQTASAYFLGIAGLEFLRGPWQFVGQIFLMVALAVLLYGWLLSGRYANLQVMLLIGIIIGAGLGSASAFMRRMLSPSEFDVLAARMFGTIAQAERAYLPIAIPLCLVATALLWWRARRLDVLALGRDVSINLGLPHRRIQIEVLTLVALLMAVSTALVGPMIFFGFLVATLTYQICGTPQHRWLLPISALTGFVVLAGAYFLMKNIFYAEGVVSIIIELVGGLVFLAVILKKGRL